MDKEKVLGLARLARIYISDEEAENLSNEFEGILNYVSEIKKAEGEDVLTESDNFPLKNVFRDDLAQNESGKFTEGILKNAPQAEGKHLKVKNIL